MAAMAQTPPGPHPVIDRAPRHVDVGHRASISGHLENGSPGQEIALEHRPAGRSWDVVKTQMTDANLRVRFSLPERRTTAEYRLSWTDEASAIAERSRTIAVRVRSKVTLRVRPRDAFSGTRVKLSGRLYPKAGGRSVRLERRKQGRWVLIDRVRVRDGRFEGRFVPGEVGRRRLRVTFGGDAGNLGSRKKKSMSVYDPDPATWYGPGFYGHTTACGQRLGYDTLGVAHRTLPCGTKVSILYKGRTITVEVIDRGPYSSAEWDLTRATAERLRFSGRDTIGATR
jgi:hypothetical protein